MFEYLDLLTFLLKTEIWRLLFEIKKQLSYVSVFVVCDRICIHSINQISPLSTNVDILFILIYFSSYKLEKHINHNYYVLITSNPSPSLISYH